MSSKINKKELKKITTVFSTFRSTVLVPLAEQSGGGSIVGKVSEDTWLALLIAVGKALNQEPEEWLKACGCEFKK